MSATAWIFIAGINLAALIVGGLYIRASIKASKLPAPPEPEIAYGGIGLVHNFGNDFVIFLLIIYGGMGVVGGFFWLLYEILEAVL